MWTRTKLTRDSVGYLEALPDEMRVRIGDVDAYFAHGSPDDHLWEYVDPRAESDLFGHYLDRLKVQLIGLGHTHLPYTWREEKGTVFNPGSVGQPRDGDWRASYAVVEVRGDEVKVEVMRVEYDVEKAASKIREAGLPTSHADRLARGT
jgi:diadenosine tetraphosphatase ApaH/serine/threonine PP2A family protein phosphatase